MAQKRSLVEFRVSASFHLSSQLIVFTSTVTICLLIRKRVGGWDYQILDFSNANDELKLQRTLPNLFLFTLNLIINPLLEVSIKI